MRNDIRYLTGEDENSGIISRHSFTQGAHDAAKWIKDRIQLSGAKCELREFRTGFAPNVIWYIREIFSIASANKKKYLVGILPLSTPLALCKFSQLILHWIFVSNSILEF